MSTHRFTVNVPNPTEKTADVTLQLQAVSPALVRRLALDVPRTALRVKQAGISLDPCQTGERSLKLRVRPHASIDAHITAVTDIAKDRRAGGTAALQLSDFRGGHLVGGMLLVCTDRSGSTPPGQVVSTPKPCPVTIASRVHLVVLGSNPSKPGTYALQGDKTMTLVVPLTNPRKRALRGVSAYLEHVGGCGAAFSPATWNIGQLPPGEIFYCTWTITGDGASAGYFEPSVVVASDGADTTRIRFRLRVTQERKILRNGSKGLNGR